MTRDDIISIARESGFDPHDMSDDFTCNLKDIERLVKTAYDAGAKDEREKSLRLWMLLDDVDTADDIAKFDDVLYRSLCRQAHQKRWDLLTGDEVDAIRARGEK